MYISLLDKWVYLLWDHSLLKLPWKAEVVVGVDGNAGIVGSVDGTKGVDIVNCGVDSGDGVWGDAGIFFVEKKLSCFWICILIREKI